MMERNFETENIILKGTFGDGELRVCCCLPAKSNGTQVVLLHGVHSSANLSHENKFRTLAGLLTSRGFTPWLVETSRMVHDRLSYGTDAASWIKDAFSDKTFAQEQEDAFIAIRDIARRAKGALLWVWGFSLGGIIAASSAAGILAPHSDGKPAIDRLIVSGTGLYCRKKAEWMLNLPILSTMRDAIAPDLLQKVATDKFIAFRGEHDEIFSKKACMDFLNTIRLPKEAKFFRTVKGADHSLRSRDGRPDPGIMEEMTDFAAGV